MKKVNFLTIDILNKKELTYIKGGIGSKKPCPCVCVGDPTDEGGGSQGGENSSGGKGDVPPVEVVADKIGDENSAKENS